MTSSKNTSGGRPATPQARAAQAREKRRAEALRANLQRRKEQARARHVRGGGDSKKPDAPGGKPD